MLDLRDKLATCQEELATGNAIESQSKAKLWYDRQAIWMAFEIGQLVLVFLPVPGKPLQTKYQGPFKILGKRGAVDYIIHLSENVHNVSVM